MITLDLEHALPVCDKLTFCFGVRGAAAGALFINSEITMKI
jgi:hypothetical protein